MKTTKVIVKDVTASALSNDDGIKLSLILDNILTTHDVVLISFKGINILTTSFLNSSIGNLIDNHGLEILSKIRLVDYTNSIASFVKKYISDIKTLSTC